MGIGRVSYPTMRIKSPSNDVKSCFKVGSVVIGSRYPILAARFRLRLPCPTALSGYQSKGENTSKMAPGIAN